MRATLFSAISIVITVVLVIVNSLTVGALAEKTAAELADAEDTVQLREVKEKYCARQKYFAITVGHGILREVESDFNELIAVAELDGEETKIIKSRLIGNLLQIKRLSKIGIEGVF